MSKIDTAASIFLALVASACGRPDAIPPAQAEAKAPAARIALHPDVSADAVDDQAFEYH